MSNVILPNISDYGAREIKVFSKKYTWRAFIVTNSALLLVFLGMFIYDKVSTIDSENFTAPFADTSIELDIMDTPPPPPEDMAAPPPPPPQVMVQGGPPQRAGTPIPIPDAEIAPDLKEFASMDVMSRASAEGGDGQIDLGGFSDKINFADKDIDVKVRETELPSPDDFIPVEKQPVVDIAKLQNLVVYPDLAKRSGIEGRVIIKVLVDKTGSILKKKVEYTDSPLLDKAALDAIEKYGKFIPAVQNKQPVACWVSVPITFKLR